MMLHRLIGPRLEYCRGIKEINIILRDAGAGSINAAPFWPCRSRVRNTPIYIKSMSPHDPVRIFLTVKMYLSLSRFDTGLTPTIVCQHLSFHLTYNCLAPSQYPCVR